MIRRPSVRALETLRKLDPATRQAAGGGLQAGRAGQGPRGPRGGHGHHPERARPRRLSRRAEVEEIRKKSECHPTGTSSHPRQANGHLRLTVRVAANGCNFVVIKRDEAQPSGVGRARL